MLAQNTVLLGLMYKYSRTSPARVLAMAALNISMIYAVLSGAHGTWSLIPCCSG